MLNAKHIISCGKKSHDDGVFTVSALILQTSALTSQPHELTAHVKTNEVIKVRL